MALQDNIPLTAHVNGGVIVKNMVAHENSKIIKRRLSENLFMSR